MSIKNLIRMAVVLALLIGISIIVPKIIYRGSNKNIFTDIQSNHWKKIIINHGQDETVLSLKNGIWKVSISSYVYNADATAVNMLIEAVGKLELGEVISNNKKRHDIFEVTDVSGARLRLFSDDMVNPQEDFYLGKATPDYTNYYFRRAGEDDVYHSRGIPSYQVKKKFKNWRNRSLGVKDREGVNKIILTEGDIIQAVILEADRWTYNGKEIDPSSVQSLLGRATAFNALDLVKPDEEEAVRKTLIKTRAEVVISGAGEEIAIVLYPSAEEKKYYALKDGEPGIFIIHENILNNIKKDLVKIQEAAEKLPETESSVNKQ